MLVQILAVLVLVTACGTDDSKKAASNTDTSTGSSYVSGLGTDTTPVAKVAVVKEKTWTDKDTGKTWMSVLSGLDVTQDDSRAKCAKGFELAADVDLAIAIEDGLFKAIPAENNWAWGVFYNNGETVATIAYDAKGKEDTRLYDASTRASFYCEAL